MGLRKKAIVACVLVVTIAFSSLSVFAAPFDGNILTYSFRMPEGRDRDWEQDIIWIARQALRHGRFSLFHPTAEDIARNVVIRENIIGQTNDLIMQIPYLDDVTIIYELMEIVALLECGHSNIMPPPSPVFPFAVVPFSDGFFILGVSCQEYSHLLNHQLVAVNGIDVDEIVERLSSIVSHDNAYSLRHKSVIYLPRATSLEHIGIMGSESSAMFTFRDALGAEVEIEIGNAYADADSNMLFLDMMNIYVLRFFADEFFAGICENALSLWLRQANLFYWHEFFPEDSLMYVRMSRTWPMLAIDIPLTIPDFLDKITDEISGTGGVDFLVIDLRHNMGGFAFDEMFSDDFIRQINMLDIGQVYILIDGQTYSAGVIGAARFRRGIDGALLLGAPTGQPPNVFGSSGPPQPLPNSGIYFGVGRNLFWPEWPGYEYDALRPDIYIPLTFDDFVNLRDPVMDFIKNR